MRGFIIVLAILFTGMVSAQSPITVTERGVTFEVATQNGSTTLDLSGLQYGSGFLYQVLDYPFLAPLYPMVMSSGLEGTFTSTNTNDILYRGDGSLSRYSNGVFQLIVESGGFDELRVPFWGTLTDWPVQIELPGFSLDGTILRGENINGRDNLDIAISPSQLDNIDVFNVLNSFNVAGGRRGRQGIIYVHYGERQN